MASKDHSRTTTRNVRWASGVVIAIGWAFSARNQALVDLLAAASAAWTFYVIWMTERIRRIHPVPVRAGIMAIAALLLAVGAWILARQILLVPPPARPLTPSEIADAVVKKLPPAIAGAEPKPKDISVPAPVPPTQKIPTPAEIAKEVVKTMTASQRPAPTFKDVPTTHPAWRFISAFARSEVSGCGDKLFCPDSLVTREEQAIFLLRGKERPDFTPPPCAAPIFSDVPCSSPFAPWINELARRGIAIDCGGGRYCPSATVSRMQMVVSALRTEEGADFTPPKCSTPTFRDVPCSHPSSPWIEELVRRGLPAKYGGGRFQPDKQATRADTAVFLVTAFHLPLP